MVQKTMGNIEMRPHGSFKEKIYLYHGGKFMLPFTVTFHRQCLAAFYEFTFLLQHSYLILFGYPLELQFPQR